MKKKRVIIKGDDWNGCKYRTVEWEQSVNIIRWEHDYELNQYVIDYTDVDKG